MSSLICQRCGSSLRAQDGSAALFCPHCGQEGALGQEVLAAAGEYRAVVERYAAQSGEQVVVARAYANLAGGNFGAEQPVPAPVAGATCRTCGAPTQFQAGAMLSHCAYCGASLLAGPETRVRGLDAAARAARGARLEALKSERRFAVDLANRYRGMLWWKYLCIGAIPFVAVAIVSLTEPTDEKLFGALGISVIALVSLGAMRLRHRTWVARAEAAIAPLVAAGGRRLTGTKAVAAWLDEHWWGDYHVYDLACAYDPRAVASEWRGLQVLVLAAPLSVRGDAHLEIFASAWYDGRSERGEGPATKGDGNLRRALQEQSLTVTTGPSGVHARLADAECRKRLKQGVDIVALTDSVARLAVSQGGHAAKPA